MDKDILADCHLERFVLGELPSELDGKIRWMVSVDPELRAAVRAIEASDREILSLYPPPAFKAALLARLKEKGRRRGPAGEALRRLGRGWFLPVSTAAAAAVLLLVVLVPGLKEMVLGALGSAGPDTSRVKGIEAVDTARTQLLIFRQKRDHVEVLGDENRARAGDLLQLAYVAAGDPFGMILSIDGRGRVTLHFPGDREGSTALVQNRKFLLPNAIELDDAPSFERFFLVTSKAPIDVAAVLGRAEDLASDRGKAERSGLDLPAGLDQFSVLIRKGEGS
jgi:hypothetical protein